MSITYTTKLGKILDKLAGEPTQYHKGNTTVTGKTNLLLASQELTAGTYVISASVYRANAGGAWSIEIKGSDPDIIFAGDVITGDVTRNLTCCGVVHLTSTDTINLYGSQYSGVNDDMLGSLDIVKIIGGGSA